MLLGEPDDGRASSSAARGVESGKQRENHKLVAPGPVVLRCAQIAYAMPSGVMVTVGKEGTAVRGLTGRDFPPGER
jgi:hypothetical protein